MASRPTSQTAEGFEVACELLAIALEQIRSDIA
jgi:hypothetical protein